MQEDIYRQYLQNDYGIISEKAIKSRISRIRSIERKCMLNVDKVICDDKMMYHALVFISTCGLLRPDNYSNALRKYYKYFNKKEFPSIKVYEENYL